jgi:tetratricopeptide (TPR) repeat protein
VTLTQEQKARLTKHYTENTTAYQLYIKGRYFLNKRTADGYKKAIEYFEQAIEADKAYALAYSGLADSYASLRSSGLLPVEETLPRARAAAEKAFQLDDAVAEVYTSVARVKDMSRDWRSAETAYKKAITLNPNYATAHHWYAFSLGKKGRLDEAIVEINRAQRLDPLSLIINTEAARLLYWARRYDEAIVQFQKALEMDPNYAVTHIFLGAAYEQKRMFPEAIAEYQKAVALGGLLSIARLGRAYALSGQTKQARKVLNQLNEASRRGFVPYFGMAILNASMGDNDQAFAWLERGFTDGAGDWALKVDPVFDSLRPDARFQDLLRRAELQP